MHYHAEIVIAPGQELADIMAPYEEEYTEDDVKGFWDWWQIGGRYTGRKTGYKPKDNDANWETCRLCNGTGYRLDDVGRRMRTGAPSYTCNGCGRIVDNKWTHGERGPGMALKWPTQWEPYAGDICAVSDTPEDLTCYTLIVNGSAYHMEEWTGKEWVETDFDGNVAKKLKALGVTKGILVTVDYHC